MTRRAFLLFAASAVAVTAAEAQRLRFEPAEPPVPVLTVKVQGNVATLSWEVKENKGWQ